MPWTSKEKENKNAKEFYVFCCELFHNGVK